MQNRVFYRVAHGNQVDHFRVVAPMGKLHGFTNRVHCDRVLFSDRVLSMIVYFWSIVY